jgi:cellobiose phosphorylase
LLDERVPYLKSPVLRPEQEEDFNVPATSDESATVYEHCVRVLAHADRLGPHGLPLMGTGDWNDGMNQVGPHGRGDALRFEPCIPTRWPGYEVTYRFGSATYHVRVDNSAVAGRGVRSVTADGLPGAGGAVPLRDDGQAHEVRVVLG